MAHTSSGVITAPVDVYGDIAAVFGIASGDVGYLFANAPINKWSLYKPVRHPSPGVLTDAMFKSVNYGYEPNSYSLLSAAVTAWQGGSIWNYLKPRGLNGGGTGVHEWYRVLDFDGYNHSSLCPFDVTYNNEPTLNSTAQYNCSFVADIVHWNEWASYAPQGYTTLYLCLVKTGGTQGTQIYPISTSQTSSFLDIISGDDKMNYKVTETTAFTAGATYCIFPCLTTYDANVGINNRQWLNLNESGGSLATWWPIPAPSTAIVPKSSATPRDKTIVTLIDFDFVSYDQINNTSTVRDVQYYIGNTNTGSLTNVTVQAYVINASGTRVNLASATSVGTIAGNSYARGTIATSSTTFSNNTPLQAAVYIEVNASYSGTPLSPAITTHLTKNAEKE